MQESPFSLSINIRKTFIKNKDGHFLCPTLSASDTSDDTIGQKLKIRKLQNENSDLNDSVEKLEVELDETRRALHKLT